MEVININTWERKEAFELFSRKDYPFYSVTVPIDVTNVKALSKSRELSFYYLMVWLCTKAVNSVEQVRIRIRGDEVVRLDRTEPSFTDMKKGAGQFYIVTTSWEEDFAAFCEKAKKKSEEQKSFIDMCSETDGLIYFSCTPWFDFTALTNERDFDRDDTIPRLAWGRYFEDGGRLRLHLSIEVNHRTIDGVHIGQLVAAIESEIAALSEQGRTRPLSTEGMMG